MRKLKPILGLLLIATLCVTAFATEFDKTASVTGGTSQRLSAVLVANSWAGTLRAQTFTVCNPAGSANTVYLGNASTDTTSGFPILAGDCFTKPVLPLPDGYDLTSQWLYVATTQNVGISVHGF